MSPHAESCNIGRNLKAIRTEKYHFPSKLDRTLIFSTFTMRSTVGFAYLDDQISSSLVEKTLQVESTIQPNLHSYLHMTNVRFQPIVNSQMIVLVRVWDEGTSTYLTRVGFEVLVTALVDLPLGVSPEVTSAAGIVAFVGTITWRLDTKQSI